MILAYPVILSLFSRAKDGLKRGAAFLYHIPMKLEINPRGNGACPICTYTDDCRIKRLLIANADSLEGKSDESLEIVIYGCPYFKEKADL